MQGRHVRTELMSFENLVECAEIAWYRVSKNNKISTLENKDIVSIKSVLHEVKYSLRE